MCRLFSGTVNMRSEEPVMQEAIITLKIKWTHQRENQGVGSDQINTLECFISQISWMKETYKLGSIKMPGGPQKTRKYTKLFSWWRKILSQYPFNSRRYTHPLSKSRIKTMPFMNVNTENLQQDVDFTVDKAVWLEHTKYGQTYRVCLQNTRVLL